MSMRGAGVGGDTSERHTLQFPDDLPRIGLGNEIRHMGVREVPSPKGGSILKYFKINASIPVRRIESRGDSGQDIPDWCRALGRERCRRPEGARLDALSPLARRAVGDDVDVSLRSPG